MAQVATTRRAKGSTTSRVQRTTRPLSRDSRIASLFTGIGGIELGLHRAGFEPSGLRLACEINPGARSILARRLDPSCELKSDIRELRDLDGADLVTAGFPCQDLSQAGLTVGIDGEKSGLVSEVFRLLAASRKRRNPPRWVLFENVPFMLRLQSGRAMEQIVRGFESLGYRWWAYRVLDAQWFGLPQRRRRVFFLASRTPEHDPRAVLFDPHSDRSGSLASDAEDGECFGFYWTEGNRGLGWAPEALPTLKGGSGLGIPSPPAIWFRDTDEFVTPSIELAERAQGFPAGWTDVEHESVQRSLRWTYVGNAVPVRVAEWVGRRLLSPVRVSGGGEPFERDAQRPWPDAAFGIDGQAFEANDQRDHPRAGRSRKALSSMPILAPDRRHRHVRPLSFRAASGFLDRLKRASAEGRLRPREDFVYALDRYVKTHPDGVRPIRTSRRA